MGSLAVCYSHGGCPHEGVHECSVHLLICEALITLTAAVSKSFAACCFVRVICSGWGEPVAESANLYGL